RIDVDLDIQVLRRYPGLELANAIVPQGQGASAELLPVAVENDLELRLLIGRQIAPAKLAAVKGETAFELAIVQRLRFALVLAPVGGSLIVRLTLTELPRDALAQLLAVARKLLAQRLGLVGRKVAAAQLIALVLHAAPQGLIIELGGIAGVRHDRWT